MHMQHDRDCGRYNGTLNHVFYTYVYNLDSLYSIYSHVHNECNVHCILYTHCECVNYHTNKAFLWQFS